MQSTMNSFRIALQRMYRAAWLDRKLYEEVSANAEATRQAYVVVFLVALATGIGTIDDVGAARLPLVVIIGMASWVVWVSFTWTHDLRRVK